MLSDEEGHLSSKKVSSGCNVGRIWRWRGDCGNVEASVCGKMVEVAG